MPTPLHILGLSGSLRRESYNTKLLKAALTHLPPHTTAAIADLSGLPLYNQDIVDAAGYPPPVQAFRQQIKEAGALLIASPEYNWSVTGVLKNAIDWASRPDKGAPRGTSPFNGKAVAIIGAGGRVGSSRGQLHLRQILTSMNVFTVPKPEVLVRLQPEPPFDVDGQLTDSVAHDLLAELLGNLRRLALQLQAETDH